MTSPSFNHETISRISGFSAHSGETGPDLLENKAEVDLALLFSLRFSS